MIPKFFYCSNDQELPGAGMVLCTERPYRLFRVLKFSPEDEKIFLNKKTAAIKIPGYRIYLQEFTQLEHWAVSQLVEKQPFEKISQLVKFYIDEKITPNAYQFKRYRETP